MARHGEERVHKLPGIDMIGKNQLLDRFDGGG
jgi:hypothetical protein